MPIFQIRPATIDDAAIVANHRARMFADMEQLPEGLRGELVERTLEYLRRAIPSGEYLGWLAAESTAPGDIVAGAGIQCRRTLPHPLTREGTPRVAVGRQAVVLNVYTERPWRRHGLAALLMQHVIDWAGTAGVDTLVLHASDDGRRLYERLGFVQTNEMRFTAALRRG